MKKRIVIIATVVLIVATLVVGNTMAFFTDKGEVNNVVTIGKVNITLKEPQFETKYGSSHTVENVTPGMFIVKDPTITNVGDNDAYIRCTVSVADVYGDPPKKKLSDAQKQDLLKKIDFNKDWTLANGYYYYQKDLGENSQVKLFNSVTIPSDWDSDVVDKEFTIKITAEAIQKDNFTPTRDSSNNIIAWQYRSGGNVSVGSDLSTESKE